MTCQAAEKDFGTCKESLGVCLHENCGLKPYQTKIGVIGIGVGMFVAGLVTMALVKDNKPEWAIGTTVLGATGLILLTLD